MRTTYNGGHYTVILEDKEGKEFTFNDIVLTQKDVRHIYNTMLFYHMRVKEITAHNGQMVTYK